MLPSIATETVTRLRGAVSTNAHGDEVVSWASPGAAQIVGCSVQPVQGEELTIGRDAVVSRWLLYAPLTADLKSSDRIRHNGNDYDIDGSVQDWPDIFGLGHRTCYLRRVDG